MRGLLDTNVIVRHLTGGPASQARGASALLGGDHELILTHLVFAEVVYVLESFYEQPRAEIAEIGRSLLSLASIVVDEGATLLRSLEIYEDDRIDFADAYLVATAERTGVDRVVSFDRGIDRARTVRRIEP